MKKIILVFTLISAFGGLLTPSLFYAQWVQQSLPVSGSIQDMVFFDANTGVISLTNTTVVLRTTNGGNNWNTISNAIMFVLDKIDSNAVYANGRRFNGDEVIYRSFDRGLTWDSVAISPNDAYRSISFVNRDTGWVSAFNGNVNLIYITTNGGQTLTVASTQTGFGQIFFLKQKYNNEYYGWNVSTGLYKTTNSGTNWSAVSGISIGAIDVFFLNKDTGWVTDDPPLDNPKVLRTTNNGLNWDTQYTNVLGVYYLCFYNVQKGWCGASGPSIILATTNSGINWGTQALPIPESGGAFFIDSIVGWVFNRLTGNNLAKTTNGGGNITFNGVEKENERIPKNYTLQQNYPNPFNPSTVIRFSITKNSNISLYIYDILGREVLTIYDNKYISAGNYKAVLDFTGINISSGIYFYTLRVNNNSDTFLETKKMIYSK